MYGDPSLIRKHVYKIVLNDPEAELVNAIVKYTGEQRQVVLRELLLARLRTVLSGQADIAAPRPANEEPSQALMRA